MHQSNPSGGEQSGRKVTFPVSKNHNPRVLSLYPCQKGSTCCLGNKWSHQRVSGLHKGFVCRLRFAKCSHFVRFAVFIQRKDSWVVDAPGQKQFGKLQDKNCRMIFWRVVAEFFAIRTEKKNRNNNSVKENHGMIHSRSIWFSLERSVYNWQSCLSNSFERKTGSNTPDIYREQIE